MPLGSPVEETGLLLLEGRQLVLERAAADVGVSMLIAITIGWLDSGFG